MQSPRRILFPCDLSPASAGLLEKALQWADYFQAELLLLHVVAEGRLGRLTPEALDDRRHEAEVALLRLLDTDAALKLKPHLSVRDGAPAAVIAQVAAEEKSDLIVMGTHGRTGLAHLALGSVAERVTRTAPCPVLVLHAESPTASAAVDEGPSLESRLRLSATDDQGPTLDLLARAVSARASDIHLDPWGHDEYLIRFRIDGRLTRYCTLGRDIAERLVHRFKLLANLDIADPFRPKEGRLRLPSSLPDLEVRITASPVSGGEAVALRLFSRQDLSRPLTGLGLSSSGLERVNAMLRHGEGIVLVTGPTGAGKTTTVYSMLAELGGGDRNIVSIEDPVEYHVPFVRQLEVDERHGLTMTAGLKTLLRMDPNVVFVGEIRDLEAADIAMRSASSGRFVLSTLHTRDVAATITACRDLRIDNRSLAGNLNGIINQRLVRRLCAQCRLATPPDERARQAFSDQGLDPPPEVFQPRGCDRCKGTGYFGRVGVFEVALLTPAVKEGLAQGVSEQELRDLLRSTGTPSLIADALDKAGSGVTGVDEALQMSAV